MTEEGKFRVDKFNGQNYQLWKMQMEDYLYQKDLYLSLSGKTKQLATRLVVKEVAQNKGIDFDEMFSLVVKMT